MSNLKTLTSAEEFHDNNSAKDHISLLTYPLTLFSLIHNISYSYYNNAHSWTARNRGLCSTKPNLNLV